MGEKPFIKFYPSDFLGGTSGLSPAERGVYMTLLCLMYEQDGPIHRDDGRLARRCGAPKAAFVRALTCLVDEGKILESEGMLSNGRAEKAIMDRTNRVETATIAANERWSAQKEKTKQNQSKSDAAAMPEQCQSGCQPEPEPDIKRDTNVSLKKRKKPATALPDDWVPDLDFSARLKEELSLTREEMNYCYQQMKGHARANDRRQADWNAAFGNWLRKAEQDGEIGPRSRGRKKSAGRDTAFD